MYVIPGALEGVFNELDLAQFLLLRTGEFRLVDGSREFIKETELLFPQFVELESCCSSLGRVSSS